MKGWFSRGGLAITVCVLAFTVAGTNIRGAEKTSVPATKSVPALSPADVKQLFVPANRPQAWPKGDWEVIGGAEYRQLLEGLKPQPPAPADAAIERAEYQAFFTGTQLSGGRFDFQILQSGPGRMLSLDPLNLAVTSLAWMKKNETRKAAWGNTKNGRTLLVLPPRDRTKPGNRLKLKGEWTALGRRFSDRVEFDLKLAQSAVTELELYLPTGWTLSASLGQIEGPLNSEANSSPTRIPLKKPAEFRLWRLVLGSETECKLEVAFPQSKKPEKPLLLAESDTTYLVRERELQIEARYELEVAFAPVSQVVFHVPRSIRVYSVSYGGDSNLTWRLKGQANRQQIIIQLPDPLLGKSRPLRIQGLTRVQSGRAWQLPRVTCPEAALLRGESHLTVEAPLELRSYELAGFRQTAISVEPDERETLTFSQIASDANAALTAFIGTPDFSASAQVVSYLTTGTEEWQMRTEITWAAQSGSRYVANCEVLPGWEILDVRGPSESSSPVISDWRLSKKGKRSLLAIEFLDALTSMQSKRVLVLARRLPLTAEQTMSLSCVAPLSARSLEQFLAVDSDKSDVFSTDSSPSVLPWTAPNNPPFVQNSSLFFSMKAADFGQNFRSFFSKGSVQDATLTLKRAEPPYDASAGLSVILQDGQIQEKLVLSINPLDAPLDRLVVLGFDFGEGWDWELQAEPLPAKAIAPPALMSQDPRHRAAAKEGWELQLPAPQSKPFKILAKRRREFSATSEPELPYLPAARDFRGTVEVRAAGQSFLNVQTTFTQEEELPEDRKHSLQGRVRRWHYQSPDARLSLALRSKDGKTNSRLGRLTLHSLINGYGQESIHRARYELESYSHRFSFPFRLSENARLIEARVNGEIVLPSRADEGFTIDFLPPQRKNLIELRYRTEWQAEGISPHFAAGLPATEVTLLDFTWQFAISPNLRLREAPTELALVSPAPTTQWTTRFFGPLGRGASEKFFIPWNIEDWSSLWSSEQREDSTRQTEPRQEFFPLDWTIHEAARPLCADTLTLRLWNENLGNQWAWVAMLVSLCLGFLFRLRRWSFRRRLGWIWFLLNFAGAGLLPLPWAFLCGGCLTGTLIAFLFPRRFLLSEGRGKTADAIGSTASFPQHPAVGILLLVGLGFFLVVMGGHLAIRPVHGQTSPPTLDAPPQEIGRQTGHAFNVMIPVNNPRDLRTVGDVIYVNRGFLKQLRSAGVRLPARKTIYWLPRTTMRKSMPKASSRCWPTFK